MHWWRKAAVLQSSVSVVADFVAFAEALPPERRLWVDEILASILLANGVKLTSEELADLDRRRTGDSDAPLEEAKVRTRLLALRW